MNHTFTICPGRCIERDGVPFVTIGKCKETAPMEADQFARAIPVMIEALQGALTQLTGPVGVWGDGRGRDRQKTGLSHEEFNALQKSRIDNVRDALELVGIKDL